MNARRLLGYVVKLPDGTRSEHTLEPHSLAHASAHLCDDGAVTPVYAKPKPAPVAPVEAEGWYALMHEGDTFLGIGVRGSEVSSRENAVRGKKLRGGEGEIVRILPDGAHEAAIAKAREEGAADARDDLRDRLVGERDDARLDAAGDGEVGYVKGVTFAIEVLDARATEAGKVGG